MKTMDPSEQRKYLRRVQAGRRKIEAQMRRERFRRRASRALFFHPFIKLRLDGDKIVIDSQ